MDDRPWAKTRQIVITLHNQHGHQWNITYGADDPFTARIQMQQVEHVQPQSGFIQFVDRLNSIFSFRSKSELSVSHLPAVEQNVLKAYQDSFIRLETLAADMHRKAGELVKANDESHRKRQQELEEQHQQRLKAIEAEHAAKLKDIAEQRAAFDKERQEFDDTKRMLYRRKLGDEARKKIENQTQARISNETAKKRLVIHVACIAVMAFAVVMTGIWTHTVLTASSLSWPPFALLSATMIGLAITFVFYLRFNYFWFDRLAQLELTNQKYLADFNRADWLSELIFESSEDPQGKVFPEQLVIRFSEGVFKPVTWSSKGLHPVDNVLGLAAGINKFSLNPKDGTVVIEQDGRKK